MHNMRSIKNNFFKLYIGHLDGQINKYKNSVKYEVMSVIL